MKEGEKFQGNEWKMILKKSHFSSISHFLMYIAHSLLTNVSVTVPWEVNIWSINFVRFASLNQFLNDGMVWREAWNCLNYHVVFKDIKIFIFAPIELFLYL